MVKWTTLHPCTCLSESDSKNYTNLEYCEKNNYRHLNTLVCKAK